MECLSRFAIGKESPAQGYASIQIGLFGWVARYPVGNLD
jgi:hypothetical protein